MRADGVRLEIDQTAAALTTRDFHGRFQVREIVWRDGLDEVLLAQKIVEARESSVMIGAAQVLERRVALAIVCLEQQRAASGTRGIDMDRRRTPRGLVANDAKEVQDRAWRQPQALERVEPDDLRRYAHVDGDGGAQVSFKGVRHHRHSADWAVHAENSRRFADLRLLIAAIRLARIPHVTTCLRSPR